MSTAGVSREEVHFQQYYQTFGWVIDPKPEGGQGLLGGWA